MLSISKKKVKKLEFLRANRDASQVQACLDALTTCAKTGDGNLLALSIEAARARCSVGEISYALEKVVHFLLKKILCGFLNKIIHLFKKGLGSS